MEQLPEIAMWPAWQIEQKMDQWRLPSWNSAPPFTTSESQTR
jgi:hypothetical protein